MFHSRWTRAFAPPPFETSFPLPLAIAARRRNGAKTKADHHLSAKNPALAKAAMSACLKLWKRRNIARKRVFVARYRRNLLF
ncbi:MAG: hypothetical protein A3E78_06585 [Alphaproteobacteria bacterium RIFCSPHIGHO2_12_FULL_63_12]|nr:MAG: hypothetical protein A3E78_06585 [Alphaproteobacteria bacterium RIFCSPHIGHO2_12_FULL_63_12]